MSKAVEKAKEKYQAVLDAAHGDQTRKSPTETHRHQDYYSQLARNKPVLADLFVRLAIPRRGVAR